MRILITGGAGFIGSRFAQKMADNGADAILIYDNMSTQVHGNTPNLDGLPETAEVVTGDIRNQALLEETILRFQPTAIAHLACETGTGQSFDEIGRYTDVNLSGTAYLLQALRNAKIEPEYFLLTSSRAVYGEGPYQDTAGQIQVPPHRSIRAMRDGKFGVFDANGIEMLSMPASHLTPPRPLSVYASTKLAQEHLVENVLGVGDTRLLFFRFQNVYGAGQSLINPYTGVLSIFMSRLKEGKGITIFEDGLISRDFVHVNDVVSAMTQAALSDYVPEFSIDIGSGKSVLIADVAAEIARLVGQPDIDIPVTGEFRVGDIRSACADISYARSALGWHPKVDLNDGLAELWDWAKNQNH